jgi:hypothetical protein
MFAFLWGSFNIFPIFAGDATSLVLLNFIFNNQLTLQKNK